MTQFAPHDLALDSVLKLENCLREISALQPQRAAGAQVEDDGKPSSPLELNLAPSSTQADIVANQAVERVRKRRERTIAERARSVRSPLGQGTITIAIAGIAS